MSHRTLKQNAAISIKDITQGIFSWRIWLMLGWQDIKLRYRRSSLGPFWITLSMALTIYTLGILYSHLWHMNIADYILFLGTGLLGWMMIASLVNESSAIFLEGKGYLLQMQMPFSIFVMRLLVRTGIIFFHNIIAILPLLIIYHLIGWHLLMLIPDLILLYLPMFFICLFLAILNLRYRDIAQFVSSIMSLAMFATPIMWMPSTLPEKYHFVIAVNPFAQFIELIRAPLMGQLPSEYSVIYVSSLFAVAFLLVLIFFGKYRHRIVFWF